MTVKSDNTNLTQRVALIAQSRYCRSCANWQRPEGGITIPITKGRGGHYWRCQACVTRRKAHLATP